MDTNNLKATLKIQLLANEVLVAESTDERLWQQVLAAMNNGSNDEQKITQTLTQDSAMNQKNMPSTGIASLAHEIGLDEAVIMGACSPTTVAPFIHLDDHCWESLKKNTPTRGNHSVPPISLSATILCLWFKQIEQAGNPTQKQAQEVLGTIGLTDKNPSRGIKNCEWLQNREGGLIINPARISQAKAIVRAYCLQKPIDL